MKTFIRGIVLAMALSVASLSSHASVSVAIAIAPPPLPVYVQPPIPGDGYIWVPGYWAWSDEVDGYYWVPGTWALAPFVGALWTPGYWGWGDGAYAWHRGYWGSHVGYYGGINYGFGYTGAGYQGGYWDHGAFRYNRSVNNLGSRHVAQVYEARVENAGSSRVSFNGGKGGVQMQPTKGEQSIAGMPHKDLTAPQMQHEQTARSNPDLRASVNHGMPKVAATPEPGAFNSPNAVAARNEAGRRSERTQAMPTQRPPERPPAELAGPPMPRQQPMERAAPPMREQAPHMAPPRQEAAHAAPQRKEDERRDR